MKKFSLKKKILLSVCAVVLVAAIVTAVIFSVSFSTDEIKNYTYTAESQTGSDDVSGCDVFVQGDGNTKLAIDSKNASVALICANGKTVFNSRSADAAENSLASILNVRLRDKNGNSYTMNSTDNSAAFGTFEIKSEKKNTTVTFNLFPDEKQAEKGLESASVFAQITVDFKYYDGGFVCSVDTSSVSLPEDFFVEKLSILPGFFSVSESFGDEYYTVPDGCGAVIDLSSVTEKPITLNMSMYGSDVTFNEYSQGAVLPFFAMNKNGSLVNTVISDGDALSEISCEKYPSGGGYLYNTFNVTACGMVDGKLRMGETYKGVVSQTYYVTEDKNADYNDIARQVRDNLISRGYLPKEISDKFIDFPFFINVLGSADGKNPATTFEDAAEITALLESRGVRNVALRFSGASKKGLASDADESSGFDSDLGGKDGFNSMVTKITDNGNSVWLDINLCTERSGSKGVKTAVYDLSSKVAGFNVQKFSVNGTNEVNNDISKAYKLITDYKNLDICINDASQLLYTDLRNGLNRQQVLENLKENLSSLSVNGDVMLSYPAVYLMGEADAVFNIPETASCGTTEGVTEVPILQMVLHGSVIYGGNYMNVTNLSQEDALLKNIEYGSVPTFLFTHESSSNLNYNIYATQTSALYSDAKALLPVMDMKITSHEKVVSGVYKITYDYSKVVYVNYNPSVVEVNGIMISAKDYVVI